MVKPSYCTSLSCNSYPCDYCLECSHAVFAGSKTVDGVKYKWEFSPWFGFMDDNIDWENKALGAYLDKWLSKRTKQKKEIK